MLTRLIRNFKYMTLDLKSFDDQVEALRVTKGADFLEGMPIAEQLRIFTANLLGIGEESLSR